MDHRVGSVTWTGPRRAVAGALAGGLALAAGTPFLVAVRDSLSLASVSLLYLLPVVATAVIGGVLPALAAAVAADLLVNFFFVPPYHALTVERGDNVVVLVVYIVTAAVVAIAVDIAARQRAAATRRSLEAAMLATATAQPVTEETLPRLLDRVRTTFGMHTVALVEDDGTVAQVGPPPSGEPVLDTPAASGLRLLAWGPQIFAEDRRTLRRLAAAAARTLEAQRLAEQADRARELAEVDRLRQALLTAVGHDLRTPLTGIKAAVSSLRQPDLELPASDRDELLATIDESTDRLDALVDNLLSMSRLRAGALTVDLRPVPLDAVVAQAVLNIHADGHPVDVDVPDDLPHAHADPGLLERVIANLLTNAQAASPGDRPIRLHGHITDDRIHLDVIDHGPGIPPDARERMFEPFQRLDDRATTAGIGLGLAIARGFTEAMRGSITPSETPGGGLTMTIALPVADGAR
jgi:two-component system sensor histidine kinase KdpD